MVEESPGVCGMGTSKMRGREVTFTGPTAEESTKSTQPILQRVLEKIDRDLVSEQTQAALTRAAEK